MTWASFRILHTECHAQVDDDSTGKHKGAPQQHSMRVLAAMFLVGLSVGVVISERMYLRTALQAHLRSRSESLSTLHLTNNHQHDGSGLSSVGRVSELDAQQAALLALLQRVAPQREVLVAVSNSRLLHEGMLDTFLAGVTRAGVKNYVVVALDAETEETLRERGFNAIHVDVSIAKSQQHTGENHAVSALKFGILRRFLELGWAVLLTDVDVVILQDPFQHLFRDSDVEGMSDGFDAATAYGAIDGFDDPSMGWARYAQLYKHFNLNSGLFYLKANERSLELVRRLEDRLSRQKYWDQTAYNEEIFFLSHGNYKSPQVSARVMDIYKFMNSKVLFKDVRHRPQKDRPGMPVMVHINYHPDKHNRMKGVIKYYVNQDPRALDDFPGGSEKGT